MVKKTRTGVKVYLKRKGFATGFSNDRLVEKLPVYEDFAFTRCLIFETPAGGF